jgi:phosphoenolpyruvate-protein kinase (PTS system EI component)
MAEKGQTLIIQGIQISPGVAKGNIHIHRNLPGPIDGPDNIPDHHIDEELSRLDVATVRISDELVVLATRVEKEMDSRLAEVFGAHQLILNDSLLREELRKEIIENLVSASSAVKMVFLRWEKRFPAQCPCRDHGSPVGRDPSWLCTCDLAFTAFRHCLSL